MHYTGEAAARDTRLLSAAFAAGLLEQAMESEVNVVNAEVLLRERGIELVEQRSSDVGEFSALITAEVVAEERTAVAAGTLFCKNMPRLVQKGDCRLESCLHGILLLITLRDVPGVIGKIGTALGKHRINIAQMSVGRSTDEPGGEQVAVLSLDGQPPAEALADVLALEPIRHARVVKLPAADVLPTWMGG
jgi:D-3-phosphoglycerate dehydrogenase